jgi:hypothetical protein
MLNGRVMLPVGHLVFKTREAPTRRLVGSTPTSSATFRRKTAQTEEEKQ